MREGTVSVYNDAGQSHLDEDMLDKVAQHKSS